MVQGAGQRPQAARDARPRGLLGDPEARGDRRVAELVDDAQPHRLALLGPELGQGRLDRRTQLAERGELLDAGLLVGVELRWLDAQAADRAALGAPLSQRLVQDVARDAGPSSSQALRTLVMEVAKRAGIVAHIHPHLMRHAYGDHIAKFAGLYAARDLLGHGSAATTETYVGRLSPDELAESVAGFGFRTSQLSPPEDDDMSGEATTGIEPVDRSGRCRGREQQIATRRAPNLPLSTYGYGHAQRFAAFLVGQRNSDPPWRQRRHDPPVGSRRPHSRRSARR